MCRAYRIDERRPGIWVGRNGGTMTSCESRRPVRIFDSPGYCLNFLFAGLVYVRIPSALSSSFESSYSLAEDIRLEISHLVIEILCPPFRHKILLELPGNEYIRI